MNKASAQQAMDSSREGLGTIPLHGDWLKLLCDSLEDLLGEDYCILSWLVGSSELQIRTRKPLGREDVLHLRQRFRENAAHQLPGQGMEIPDLHAVINGRPEEELPEGHRILRTRTSFLLPLSIEGKALGLLQIVPLQGGGQSPRHQSFIGNTWSEVGSVLRILWTLVLQERGLLEAIINSMMDGILLTDEQGRVLVANPAMSRLLGVKKQGFLTLNNLAKAQHYNIVPLIRQAIKNRMEKVNTIVPLKRLNRVVGINIRRIRGPGQGAGPTRLDQPLGWLVIARDITDSWQMDRLRKEFFLQVVHELHSPLTAVLEGLRLVWDGTTGPINERQRQCLTFAQENVKRLGQLVNRLMQLAQVDFEKEVYDRRKEVHLDILVQEALELYRWRAEQKGIRLCKRFEGKDPVIRANRDRIMQVLSNLIDNAIKFTPSGGEVQVRVRSKPHEVRIAIKDTGIGIPASELERIFEHFHRVEQGPSQRTEGFGLGLSIAREIVASYGGSIWARSQLGKGSTFYVTLPKGKETKDDQEANSGGG